MHFLGTELHNKLELAIWAGLVVVSAGCGDPEVTACAEGTFDGERCLVSACPPGQRLENDVCVTNDAGAPITTINPNGGSFAGSVTVTLAADEPAVIYYTTNGTAPSTSSTKGESPLELTLTENTELSYFAIDTAGNQETTKTATFDVDPNGPDTPSNFDATANGTDVELTWVNPNTADFETVMVVRSAGTAVAGFTPRSDADYTVGQLVAPNVRVAYVGAADSFTDGNAVAGANHYAAYSRDTIGNHSSPVAASVSNLPFEQGQQATIEISVADKQVTVTQQPKDLLLTPVGGQFPEGGDTAHIDLDVTSRAGQTLTQVKLVMETVTGATAKGNAEVATDPTVHLGAAMLAGSTTSGAIELSAIDGQDPITITVSVFSDPLLIGPGYRRDPKAGYVVIDPRSGTTTGIPCPTPAPTNGGQCGFAGFSHDPVSSKIYIGTRMAAKVLAVDPIADQVTISGDLADLTANPLAGVPAVAFNATTGNVVAVVNKGQQWRSRTSPGAGDWTFNGAAVDVVKLNASDLTEVGRTTLISSGTIPYTGRAISIDNTGSFAAVAVTAQTPTPTSCNRRVFLVNLSTLTAQSVCPPGTSQVTSVAISPNGDAIFVAYRDTASISRWTPPAAPVDIALPGGGTFPQTGAMYFGPGGRLFMNVRGSPAGLYAFNPSNGQFDQITPQTTHVSGISPSGERVFTVDRNFPPNLRVIDIASGTVISTVTLSNLVSRGHFGAWVTP